MSVEAQRVVYGATLDIPYAIGSVSIPLNASPAVDVVPAVKTPLERTASPSPTPPARRHGVSAGSISSARRCTHHRYCYLRDGGDLTQDAFFRWLERQRRAHDKEETPQPVSEISSAGTAPNQLTPSPCSPSLLYASVECVVFVLPSSFPHPRRVVRHPPFLIEDDTWAEHVVEAQVHFKPHLHIPPATMVHQALLERRVQPPLLPMQAAPTPPCTRSRGVEVREVWVPQLSVTNSGKPKLPPVAAEATVTQLSLPAEVNAAMRTAVVAEKVDTLHLYHPSVTVLRHVREVQAVARLPVLAELREAYDAVYAAAPAAASLDGGEGGERSSEDTSLSTPFQHPWSLPFEGVIAAYAAQRASTSEAVLQCVLERLKRERADMEAACERSMNLIAELATAGLPSQLQCVHERCMKLYRKE